MVNSFDKKVAGLLSTLRERVITDAPYSEPLEYFSSIETETEGDLLLLGGDDVSGNGRFSIAAVKPLFTISAKNEVALLKIKDEVSTFKISPLEVIEILHKYLPKQLSKTDCFDGGLVFLLPYELNRYYEKLPSLANSADEASLWCGMYPSVRVFDSLNMKAYDISFTDNTIQPKHEEQSQQEPVYFISPFQCDETREKYIHKIEDIQKRISNGDAYQVNLSRKLSATFEGSALALFGELAKINPASFSAYINGGDLQFISMSPELFFKVNSNRIITKPVKGTSPRSDDSQLDLDYKSSLEHSEKDKAENVMIVDLMRNDLSRICSPNSVKVTSLFDCESLPTVHHLVSTVEGELQEGVDFPHILKALFPGGSVTGAPKIKSMEIIQELETSQRGFYCGSLACCGINGDITASILIRTLTISNGKAVYRTGGGITAYSNPDSEFIETEHKAEVLKMIAKKGVLKRCLEHTA